MASSSSSRKFVNASAAAKMLNAQPSAPLSRYESDPRSSQSSFSQDVVLPPLLSGELFPELVVGEVAYVTSNKNSVGQLMLTNYRLYFVETANSQPSSECDTTDSVVIDLPLGLIEECKKVGGYSSRGGDAYAIEVYTKDGRLFRFAYKSDRPEHKRKEIFNKLLQLAFPYSHRLKPFAFYYKEKIVGVDDGFVNGWNVYDIEKEYKRMFNPPESDSAAKHWAPESGSAAKHWRISKVNVDYSLCDTYPPILAVPKGVSDQMLQECAKFRSRGRIPVLSWLHPTTGVCLCRSAQPNTALSLSPVADEKLLEAIKEAGSEQGQNFFIVDARPLLNALGNKVKGGGYENTQTHYMFAKYCNFNIENIHAMRKSQKALFALLQHLENPNWYADFEKTEWLKHQFYILRGACQIVDFIETNKNSVLVHCSDGWDRTAQLTALALLMLDPFYRTIRGFAVLIEKEWISFGHKFLERYGLGIDITSDSGERSPIFPQFIECVYQLFRQFPTFFEFDERLLIFLIDQLYSNLFGTFLNNSWREREDPKARGENPVLRAENASLRAETNSVWSYVLKYRDEFRNPFYNEASSTQRRVIMPVVSVRRLDFWRAYYLRPFVDNMHKELVYTKLTDLIAIKDHFEDGITNFGDNSVSSTVSGPRPPRREPPRPPQAPASADSAFQRRTVKKPAALASTDHEQL